MVVGKTPSLTEESTEGTHGVLERTQTDSPRKQHLNGPICLWVEVTESGERVEQAALFSL